MSDTQTSSFKLQLMLIYLVSCFVFCLQYFSIFIVSFFSVMFLLRSPVMYLRVAAEDDHSPFGSPLGQGLDGGVVVLRPRQPVSVAT